MMMRLAKLRQILADNDLDAVVISQPENRRYLSGFTGTRICCIHFLFCFFFSNTIIFIS